VDGDGIPDYALGSPFDSGALLQSGADGSTIITFYESPGTSFGAATASIGDLDGDGHAEFAVSAPDMNTAESGGVVRLYHGQSLTPFDELTGSVGSGFGARILAVSDRTRDGFPELLISAPRATSASVNRPGEVALVDAVEGDVLLVLAGDLDNGSYGLATAEASDLSGDGVPDYVIGAPQYSASAAGRIQARSGADGTLLWSRDGAGGDVYGSAACVLGDLDGDGVDDLAVGAPQNWKTNIGDGYVDILSGADGGWLGRVEAPPGAVAFGASLLALGDLGQDGTLELVAGSRIPIQSRAYVLSARRIGPLPRSSTGKQP
jgi:hypothetical protein